MKQTKIKGAFACLETLFIQLRVVAIMRSEVLVNFL